jgi:hypothetical protein
MGETTQPIALDRRRAEALSTRGTSIALFITQSALDG